MIPPAASDGLGDRRYRRFDFVGYAAPFLTPQYASYRLRHSPGAFALSGRRQSKRTGPRRDATGLGLAGGAPPAFAFAIASASIPFRPGPVSSLDRFMAIAAGAGFIEYLCFSRPAICFWPGRCFRRAARRTRSPACRRRPADVVTVSPSIRRRSMPAYSAIRLIMVSAHIARRGYAREMPCRPALRVARRCRLSAPVSFIAGRGRSTLGLYFAQYHFYLR